MANDNDFPDSEFTPLERKLLRKWMRDMDRANYAKKIAFTTLASVGGVLLFILAFKDGIAGFFKGLFR